MALEALKDERAAAELTSCFGVHPMMIQSRKRVFLEDASGVFVRGGRKVPEIGEEQVKELHAKIRKPACGQFLPGKREPWKVLS